MNKLGIEMKREREEEWKRESRWRKLVLKKGRILG